MKQETKALFAGIATLTGTVIGAGFLGIPYVVGKSGFLIGLIWMVIICVMLMFVNLIMGEIVLSTEKTHHIPGYASKYLGRKTKMFVFLASIFGFYAALIAYLIGEGESLSFIFTGTTNYSFVVGILFWVVMAAMTFRGLKSLKKLEPFAVLAIFLIAIVLGILHFNQIDLGNLTYSNMNFMFLPFGVILFAFLGISSVPEMKRVMAKNKNLLKKAIIIGSLIPFFIYILFTVIVLGFYGAEVSEIATLSFGKIVALLGVFTMLTSFLPINMALQDTYRFDFGFSPINSWFISIIIPLICFILIKVFDLAGFVKVLSLGGAISGGLLSIAILLIHEHLRDKKLERKPEFRIKLPLMLKILFIILFLVGILYEFL